MGERYPGGLPEGRINAIDVSPHDRAAVYIAVTRFQLDDFRPYIYKTADYGKTWTLRIDGIPEDDPVRVVREDRGKQGLLYAGTQRGIHISFDDGEHWQSLRLNLPAVPITDLTLRNEDLIAATEGRGFWILDDLSPLQQTSDFPETSRAHVLRPRRAFRTEGSSPDLPGLGKNAPSGAILDYYLAEPSTKPVTLEILDSKGDLVRSLAGEHRAGMNRLVWDLRHEGVARVPGTFLAADYFGTAVGHRVAPGTYQVRLRVGEDRLTETLEVVKDPRSEATVDDLREQAALLTRIADSIDEIHRTVVVLQNLRGQVRERVEAVAGVEGAESITASAEILNEKLSHLEERLMQPHLQTIMDAVNFPTMLNEQFLFLKGAVAGADARPTEGQKERFEELEAQWRTHQEEMQRLLEEDLARFNLWFQEREVPAVIVPEAIRKARGIK